MTENRFPSAAANRNDAWPGPTTGMDRRERNAETARIAHGVDTNCCVSLGCSASTHIETESVRQRRFIERIKDVSAVTRSDEIDFNIGSDQFGRNLSTKHRQCRSRNRDGHNHFDSLLDESVLGVSRVRASLTRSCSALCVVCRSLRVQREWAFTISFKILRLQTSNAPPPARTLKRLVFFAEKFKCCDS